MAQSIKQRTQGLSIRRDARELKFLLDAALTDLAASKTAFDTLVAKMNLDTGIGDDDYAAPGALTLVD